MSSSQPDPVERDSRGILDPWLLRQRVQLTRYPAGPVLDGLVDRFWAVRWDLPPGTVHQQQVLTHPGANVSIGHANGTPGQREPGPVEARLYGVARGLSTRVLAGQGWTVAALTWPGGLGAFITGSAAELTDRVVPLGQALGVGVVSGSEWLQPLRRQTCRQPRTMPARPMARRRTDSSATFSVAEGPTSPRATGRSWRPATCASALSLGQRTPQRMLPQYAGCTTWVIRRYRPLEAAEMVREGVCPCRGRR
jgi:hypothetical protein